MIKVGINGFGRIGRAFFRINLIHKKYNIVAINDIDPDIHNLAYLLKYDTTYGRLYNDKIDVRDSELLVNEEPIKMYNEKDINRVSWKDCGVDVVIDSSGVFSNVLASKKIADKEVRKVIVTHSPKEGIDVTLMRGVNENEYDKKKHQVISSSICDANAVAPFYKAINDVFGVEMGEITTLHPWLSYQNLVDGTVKSVSSPGHYWKDYALGRSSIGSLIPKDTTLVTALEKVLPGIGSKVHSASFRTPTSIVSAADGVLLLKKNTSLEDVKQVLNEYCTKNPMVLQLDDRSLVSIDYLANEYAAVVDTRWLYLNGGRMLKFVLWYDNEWGYAKRAYDIVSLL